MESALETQFNYRNSEENHEQALHITESFCYFTVSDPDIVSTSKVCGTNTAADSNFYWEVQHSWKAEAPSPRRLTMDVNLCNV